MRPLFLFLFLFPLLRTSYCQKPTDTLPPFKMVLSDGSLFTPDRIPRNKPVILIYFSPDCDHCQVLMKEFFRRAEDFKKAEVVMITFRPLNEVNRFIRDFNINQFHNITVGREVPAYFIRYYYHLTNTPFTALFDRHRKMICSYGRETSVPDLADRLGKIK